MAVARAEPALPAAVRRRPGLGGARPTQPGAALRPGPSPAGEGWGEGVPGRRVPRQARHPTPEFSRFLYTAVGGPWHWRGRLPWTWRQWEEWLGKPGLQTWVIYLHGTPAGYTELLPHDDGSMEIKKREGYF